MSTPPRHFNALLIPLLTLAFFLIACDNPLTAAAPSTRPAAKSPFTPLTHRQPKLNDHVTEALTKNTEKFELTFIPAGEFLMGSPAEEPGHDKNEGPQHRVRVNSFWMARTELTADLIALWVSESDSAQRLAANHAPLTPQALRAATQFPTGKLYAPFPGADSAKPEEIPAVTLTAYGAQQFCRWLSARTGHYYRLPTEAEWEYACRAGSTTPYFFGADASKLTEYAWFDNRKGFRYYPNDQSHVAKKKPNPWGLYDMLGNVAEYVLDDWCDNYDQYAGKIAVDPWRTHHDATTAIVRGGNADNKTAELRSAARQTLPQIECFGNGSKIFSDSGVDNSGRTGFRIVSPLQYENDGRESCIPPPTQFSSKLK